MGRDRGTRNGGKSGGVTVNAALLARWEPLTLTEVGALLREAPFRWWVAGGWAIDLFIGQQTRDHQDVEVAVARQDQVAMRERLRGWELWYVPVPEGLRKWAESEPLPSGAHEVWCRDSAEAPWRLEILVEEVADGRWSYRRDRRITLPLERFGLEIDGLPVVRPEVALLYKGKGTRPHDEQDFSAVLPQLDEPARLWLAAALRLANTGSGWLKQLEEH